MKYRGLGKEGKRIKANQKQEILGMCSEIKKEIRVQAKQN